MCLGPDGKITAQGSFADLNNAGGYVTSLSLSRANKTRDIDIELVDEDFNEKITPDTPDDKEGDAVAAVYPMERGSDGSLSSSETLGARDAEAEMSRQTGDVQIYLYYVKSVGWWASMVFVVAICGFVFCISFPSKCSAGLRWTDWIAHIRLLDIWVQWWAAANERDPNGRLGYWLGVYAGLGCAAIVCLFVSCW